MALVYYLTAIRYQLGESKLAKLDPLTAADQIFDKLYLKWNWGAESKSDKINCCEGMVFKIPSRERMQQNLIRKLNKENLNKNPNQNQHPNKLRNARRKHLIQLRLLRQMLWMFQVLWNPLGLRELKRSNSLEILRKMKSFSWNRIQLDLILF